MKSANAASMAASLCGPGSLGGAVNIYRSNNHPPIHLFHKQIPFAKRPPRVMFVVGFASSLITSQAKSKGRAKQRPPEQNPWLGTVAAHQAAAAAAAAARLLESGAAGDACHVSGRGVCLAVLASLRRRCPVEPARKFQLESLSSHMA